MGPGLILQHEDAAPPALFADWCERRGIPFEVAMVWEDGMPDREPSEFAWICSLGSDHTPGERHAPEWIDREVAYLRRALAAEVPILGLCFGGQALAAAAGAQVSPADPPEVGWFEIETSDPDIPAGPWLYFHYDQFDLPEGAEELARSPAGTAAFRIGRSLGLQFHPEATPAIADGWTASEAERLIPLGISPSAVAIAGEEAAEAAAAAAEVLFDRWWEGLELER